MEHITSLFSRVAWRKKTLKEKAFSDINHQKLHHFIAQKGEGSMELFSQKSIDHRLQDKTSTDSNGHNSISSTSLSKSYVSWSTTKYERISSKISDSSHGNDEITLISKNGNLTHYIWHVQHPITLYQAMMDHIGPKPESMLAQMIYQIGGYTRKVLNRRQWGIQSNVSQQKEVLQRFCQDRLLMMFPLEGLINHRDKNVQDLIEALENYKVRLTEYKNFQENDDHKESLLLTLQNDIRKTAQEQLQGDINRIDQYIEHMFKLDSLARSINHDTSPSASNILTPCGTDSLFSFIKTQSLSAILGTKQLNQDLVYSRYSIMRGDLHDELTKANLILRNYDPSLTLKVMPEHQNGYLIEEKKPSGLAIPMPIKGHKTVEEIEAIYHWYDYQKDNPKDLIPTRFTQFRVKSKKLWREIFKKLLYFFLNLILDILWLPIDLLFGIISPFKEIEFKAYQDIRYIIHSDIDIADQCFSEESKKRLQTLRRPLGKKIGEFLGSILKNILLALYDVLMGLYDIAAYKIPDGMDKITCDFKEGYFLWKGESKQVYMEENHNPILDIFKSIKTDYDLYHSEYSKDYNKDEKSDPSPHVAIPAYKLKSKHYNDILNQTAHGLDVFLKMFSEDIFAGNPATTALFMGLYTSAGLFVLLSSHLTQTHGLIKAYQDFSVKLGQAMANSPVSSAISSAWAQGYFSSLALNVPIKGKDSALANCIKNIIDNPSEIIAALAVASLTGYLLGAHIEFLSSELGSAPWTGYPFIGLKCILIPVELFLQPDKNTHDSTAAFSDFKEALKTSLKENGIDDEKIRQVLKRIDALQDSNLTRTTEDQQLHFLLTLQQLLSFKSCLFEEDKRAILKQAHTLFPEDKLFVKKISKMLYQDEHECSIVLTTLKIAFKYVVLIVRCCIALLAFMCGYCIVNPFIELFEQIKQDAVRVFTALGKLIGSLVSFGFIILYNILWKLIADEVVARISSCFWKEKSNVSKGTYKVAFELENFFLKSFEFFSQPISLSKGDQEKVLPHEINSKVVELESGVGLSLY